LVLLGLSVAIQGADHRHLVVRRDCYPTKFGRAVESEVQKPAIGIDELSIIRVSDSVVPDRLGPARNKVTKG
jgi:hypothetical protein